MKSGVVFGAFLGVAALAFSGGSHAFGDGALSGADETISKVVLSKKSNKLMKSIKPKGKSGATVDIVIDKNSKIESKKFSIGALDDGDKPISKLSKDECARYVLIMKVLQKKGDDWKEILKIHAHGEWESSKAAGTVDKCVAKDGWGTAPNLWTKKLTQGPDPDTYRVVVSAGLTKGKWPKNANEDVVEPRKVSVGISML